ncbi:isochorismate synthase [Fischerella sp. PCC 9605]|uniref:isochorismate synthase n=1 Tax=Fischerella sp. PCC 9605 TaxID=1173024 RepID=UPI00047E045F|nr:isochorismate synthase [Fischerella sp. PCC 9605]
MTVSQCPADFFVYNKELYQFLVAAQRKSIKNNSAQIASISLEINLVDPLVVMDKLAQPNQLNFYWENKGKKEAIAAIDAVAKLQIEGKERFSKSEKFIKYCLKNIINFSSTEEVFSRPLFFCSFSFFERNYQEDYPFPASTVFVPRWQIAVKDKRCILVANTIIHADVNIEEFLYILWRKIEIIHSLEYHSPHRDCREPKFSKKSVANPEKFKLSVFSALETIKSRHVSKIVLADALDVISNTPFNLFNSLHNLRQLHPNCYIFSTSNGKGQNFIGASPERLISIHKQQLITDALAGSAPRGKTPAEDAANADRLLNSDKERHEHSLVIDFITQRLSQLGLLPQLLPPRLRQLSNIQHLWTPISALVPDRVHPLKIVSQLHPTPAVAGAAPDIACAEIRRYESFERGLYAAPLGWVDADGNCEFIVGIRSALIDGDRARLYAGAGIVAGSDPEKELAEIQLKLQALLKALV